MRAVFIGVLVTHAVSTSLHATALQDPGYEAEIQALSGRRQIREALAIIQRLEPKTRTDHMELTQIPAPPFGEAERAQAYVAMLREAGVDTVYVDEVGNVIARRRGTNGDRTVTIAAHLDTVFPEGTDVTVTLRGDTLYAPGIGDDTRGLIAVLTVLRALNEARIATSADLLFVGTVGEEGLGDLRGVKHLFREGGPRIDSWIAVDGTRLERIVHRGLGSHRYRVTFDGPGGHSWGAFGLGNPAHALGRAVSHFDDAAKEFVKVGPTTSYNIGRVGGGTSVNSIPFAIWMEVDMRSVSPERLLGIDSIFQAAMLRGLAEQNEIRTQGDSLTVNIEMIGDRPSGEIGAHTPLVSRAHATVKFFGATPELAISSTDSNVPISRGIPAITIGSGGSSSGAHSLGEWWLNESGHLAIQGALMILVAEAGLAEPVP